MRIIVPNKKFLSFNKISINNDLKIHVCGMNMDRSVRTLNWKFSLNAYATSWNYIESFRFILFNLLGGNPVENILLGSVRFAVNRSICGI